MAHHLRIICRNLLQICCLCLFLLLSCVEQEIKLCLHLARAIACSHCLKASLSLFWYATMVL